MPGVKKTVTSSVMATRSDQDRVRLLRDTALKAELDAAATAALESNRKINPYIAAEIAHEALMERSMPPEIVRHWLVNGLAKYLRSGGASSLDEALGLPGRGSGASPSNERALLKRRNDIFAGLFWLLTSNGATVTSAAQLIWARDRFLRSLAPKHFAGYPSLSTDDKAIPTLTKYWNRTWKKKYDDMVPAACNARLEPVEGVNYDPASAHFIWHAMPQYGWPLDELNEARKSGLKI